MSNLISREALMEFARNHVGHTIDCNDIARFPAVDAEPVRHGRWKKEFWTIERQRVCSVCIRTVRQPSYDQGEIYLFKYCPYCGAKMDGGADEK